MTDEPTRRTAPAHPTDPTHPTETGRHVAVKDQTQTGTRRLVIVESPAKAKTIAGYLGPGYRRRGQRRPHPRPADARPSCRRAEKKGRFGKFAVDVDADFEPYYVVDADKKKKVAELKRALKNADELFLATDEDREGEAIAWHLLQVLEPKVPVRRMVFHEITRDAIRAAVEQTRDLDQSLVDAQETRRILDRLYGYEVSPVLWRKVRQGLSAGRVQSVATRLVVERERERIAFRTVVLLGHRRRRWSSAAGRGQPVRRPAGRRSTAAGSRPAATSAGTASRSRASTACTSTRRPPAAWPTRLRDAAVRGALASRTSPTAAGRPRRS